MEQVFDLFIKHGDEDYIGEEISQTEHMLQAAYLANKNNCSKELILAALFHDIGHLIKSENKNIYGVKDHEKIGANYIRQKGFEHTIIPELIEKHVKAKRYLAYKNIDYHDTLSHASKMTLIEQGGMMTKQEAEEFEKDKLFHESIQLRKFDEQAKDKNLNLSANKEKLFEQYKKIMLSLNK